MKKLCVFLTDPMSVYHAKGEIKPRYYNPGDYFDQIDMISFSKADIAETEVQTVAGRARLKIHCLGRLSLFSLLTIRRRLKRLVRGLSPDIIRAYDPSLRGALAVNIARKLHIPAVLSIHSHMDEQRRFDRRPLLRVRRFLERYALGGADRIICVSDYVQTYVARYGGKKSEVIYNRVDIGQFKARKQAQKENKPLTVLTIGRLDREKNQECLLRAVKDLDIKLISIGDGKKYSSLSGMVRDLKIEGKVDFIKSVPHSRIQEYYASADIFAIATHFEGFCIPVLEAMASGLPVVASNVGSIREILGDSGILADNTPDAFERALRRLVDDAALRRSLAEKAKMRAAEINQRDNEGKERELYDSLLKSKSRLKKILYFGYYDPLYPRTRVIIRGLREYGHEVIECNGAHLRKNLIRMYWVLWREALQYDFEAMIVGTQNSLCLPLAWVLTKLRRRKRLLLYDALFSKYDTVTFDKKMYARGSLISWAYWMLDKISCILSDKVIVDTISHKRYFCKQFGLKDNKCEVVYVGAEEDVFCPLPKNPGNERDFVVGFSGSFVPLQGTEFIIKAADILREEKVFFNIVGDGMLYKEARELSDKLGLSNIRFQGWVQYEKVPEYLKEADVCLGVFGVSEKAKRIIPIKAYQALAMAKALITGDSPAAHEIFTDRKDVLLCRMEDAQALADAILLLKKDESLRQNIARNGHQLFKGRFQKRNIGERISQVIG